MASLQDQTKPEQPGKATPLSDIAIPAEYDYLPDLIYPWPHFYLLADYGKKRVLYVKEVLNR